MMHFFFNDTATTEIYTLSLHDALPISRSTGSSMKTISGTASPASRAISPATSSATRAFGPWPAPRNRSEEHTSELQSHLNLVCRLLLEKKKIHTNQRTR